jgi:hypothetical protein
MSEVQQPDFSLPIPERLGMGEIVEQEYVPTPGTQYLLAELLGLPTDGVEWDKIHAGSILVTLKVAGEEMAMLCDPDTAPLYLRSVAGTDRLISDQYDMAEALRLTTPLADYVYSKAALNIPLSDEEQTFLGKRAIIEQLNTNISDELSRPYRLEEEAEDLADTTQPLESDFEQALVNAIDRANRFTVITGTDLSLDLGPKYTGKYAAIFDRVMEFYTGKRDRLPVAEIAYVHTVESADVITEIQAADEIGRICVAQAGAPTRQSAWFGNQTELAQTWVKVVSGGSVAQN